MSGTVERRNPVAVAIAEDDRQWRNLERRAEVLAASAMVPRDLRGNPKAVIAAFNALTDLGVRPSAATLSLLHFIEGRPEPSAQLLAALLGRAGYEIVWTALTADRAAGHLIRPDGTITIDIEWTLGQAEAAGLRDQWVERWVKNGDRNRLERFVLDRPGVTEPSWVQEARAAGNVKRSEAWWRYPDDMLAAKVIRRLVKRFAAEVTLGVDPYDELWSPPTVSGLADADDPYSDDDDPVDAEIIDDQQASSPGGGDDELVHDDWVRRFAIRTREHAAVLGVDADDLRHAIVHTATKGRVESTKEVRTSEAAAVAVWTAMLLDGHARLTERPDSPGYRLVEHDPSGEP